MPSLYRRRPEAFQVGALIVIEHNLPLDDVVRTGEIINADINQRLIENIFFKNSPLHDGAMVISKKRIKAAGCILPVSHNLDIPKELGLRHRAAMGIPRCLMRMPSLYRRRPEVFQWLTKDNSICV